MDPIEPVQYSSREEKESTTIDSWWGAFGALMVWQAYGFIILQGLAHLFGRKDPHEAAQVGGMSLFSVPFFFVFVLLQAQELQLMNYYLRKQSWQTALRFWHTPLELLKFLAALVCTAGYVYLLTGHDPIPRNPSFYQDIGIFGNLMFQLGAIAVSLFLNLAWKLSRKVEALRGLEEMSTTQSQSNTSVGLLFGIPIGIAFIAVGCQSKGLFYVTGILGYGMIALTLSRMLSRKLSTWVWAA